MQKKLLSFALAAFAAAGLISCGGKSIKNGTYTSSVQGMNDAVEVSVTIADKKIADVQVTKNSETPGIGSPLMDANGTVLTAGGMAPTELIPAEIVKHQSVNVDVVTGATITSAAIKAAVSNCLKDAKANPSDWNAKPEAAAAPENASADVVVVGGGIAGMMAAAKAHEQGATVALIEKEGLLGGSSVNTSGVWQGNPDNSYDSILFLKSIGLNYTVRHQIGLDKTALNTAGGSKASGSIASTTYVIPDVQDTKRGWKICEVLNDYLVKENIAVFLNTPGTKLLMNGDGSVAGVVSETKRGTKTFKAKAVILCTGGYHQNEAMMKKYMPISAGNYSASAIGNTGDAITMGEAVGAQVYDNQVVFGGYFVFNPRDVYRGGYAYSDTIPNTLYVSKYGDRRFKEDGHAYSATAMYNIYGEPTFVWDIIDSDAIASIAIRTDMYTIGADEILANKNGLYEVYKADTLAELAEKIGVIPTLFLKTVEHYNDLCDRGVDSDWGKSPQLLEKIDKGPFYAIKGYSCDRSTVGGIVTNVNSEVISQTGAVIPGLYAAGDASNRAFYGGAYLGASGLTVASTRGYMSGRNAAQYALRK